MAVANIKQKFKMTMIKLWKTSSERKTSQNNQLVILALGGNSNTELTGNI